MSKASQFKSLLTNPGLDFIMEAHNGLSAKIVEETGFKGIWASGLSISASMGVRDNNEASWTQVLEVLEFMSDATNIPIMLDGDTGYGNFNNMRRLVQKLEQRNIAAVCIEDKLFPKTNSFIGSNQPLADMDEFCGKIKAGKDSQLSDDFSIVARVEALIAGWGVDEALRRSEAYHEAGADAILMHSKKSTPDEILAFTKAWDNRCPVVIVPTMYYQTPTDVFRDAGVSLIIWANHNMRVAMAAMRDVSRRIFNEESLLSVEDSLPTVKEVFKLQNNDELQVAEKRYLPSKGGRAKAVVLAASRGSALGPLTEDRPKAMIDVRGQPLLRRTLDTMKAEDVTEVTVVRGYRKDAIDLPDVKLVDNDAYETTGQAASLACAAESLKGDVVLAYGDILFRPYILDTLLDAPGDITLVVDASFKDRHPGDPDRLVEAVRCSRPYKGDYLSEEEPVELTAIGDVDVDSADGEWIGLMKFSAKGSELLNKALDDIKANGDLDTARLTDIWSHLMASGAKLDVVYISGHWLDVDDAFDLAEARDFL